MIMDGKGGAAALEMIISSSANVPKALVYSPDTHRLRNLVNNVAAAEQYDEPGRFTAFIG